MSTNTTYKSLIIVGCIGALLFPSKNGNAQVRMPSFEWGKKQIRVTAQNSKFVEFIKVWSQQTGGSILADNEPDLQIADINFQGTAEEALNLIADKFDFTWSVGKSGVILMSRRFKSATAMPQLVLPEIRNSVQSVLTALRFFPDDITTTNVSMILRTFAASFSQQQLDSLRSGHVLDASELNEQQFSLLKRATLVNIGGQAPLLWERLADTLDALPRSYLQLRKSQSAEVVGNISNHSNVDQLRPLSLSLGWEDKVGKRKATDLYQLPLKTREDKK